MTAAGMSQIARQHLPVDLDVFRLILASLPYAELLTISLVSRFYRDEATKELLMRPVKTVRNERLRSFCLFALSGDPGKLSYLRKLTIVHIEEPFSIEDKQAFVRVLNRCRNLRKLELRWCDVLVQEPSIPEAISALPRLTHFSAALYRDRAPIRAILLTTVLNLKASLRCLHLPMVEDGLSKVNVLRDLARVHGGLEDFTLQFDTFTAPGVAFPAVRKLRLALGETVPLLRDLCTTFPNVRELSIEYHMHLDGTPPRDTPDPANGSCWPSLDLLRASALIIHTLGIACPVRRLDAGYYDANRHELLAETVARLQPRRLTLDNYCARDWPAPRAEPSVLLHGSGEAGVRHLFLKTSFAQSQTPETSDVLKSVRPLLRSARVELVHLALSELFYSDDPDEIVSPPMRLHPDLPEEEAAPVLDVDALARGLALACPSIRTVAITVAFVGHAVWSVHREVGEVALVRFGAYEGGVLLEREAKRCLED